MEHGVNPPTRLTNEASVRLVCLPFAGGGSASYYRWRRHVPAWIELAPVTLPGHDGRLAERPLTDLRTLVELLVDELQPTLDKPFVLLGHSMGAWLAFEMARAAPPLTVAGIACGSGQSCSARALRGIADSRFARSGVFGRAGATLRRHTTGGECIA